MINCSLGFIFDTELKQVLLVHKNRPAWQSGLINGVGGKIEAGETAVDCMVRECQEETKLIIAKNNWVTCAEMIESNQTKDNCQIIVFAAVYNSSKSDAQQNDHEEIEWFPYQELPANVVSNLHFLVPLAREKLLGHDSKAVLIKY